MTTRKKSEETERLELHLRYLFDHGVNFQDRIISVTGEIDDDTYHLVDAAITEMERHNRKSITIKLNSFGGHMYSALAIVGRMRNSKAQIITQGYGKMMSAANLILAAGHRRQVSQFAWGMFHEPNYEIGYDRKSIVEAEVEQVKREWNMWCKWMGEFTKKPKKFWLENGVHLDKYLTPEEMRELGVVDEII